MSKARELQEKFKTMHEKIERPSADWSILYSLNKGRVGKNSLDQNKNEVEGYLVLGADDETVTIGGDFNGASAIQDKGKNAYLIGTNDFADWPGKGKIGKLGKASYGEVVGVYFTRVNGRTFEFVQVESLEKLESYIPQNTLGLLARSIARKQLEKELE